MIPKFAVANIASRGFKLGIRDKDKYVLRLLGQLNWVAREICRLAISFRANGESARRSKFTSRVRVADGLRRDALDEWLYI